MERKCSGKLLIRLDILSCDYNEKLFGYMNLTEVSHIY